MATMASCSSLCRPDGDMRSTAMPAVAAAVTLFIGGRRVATWSTLSCRWRVMSGSACTTAAVKVSGSPDAPAGGTRSSSVAEATLLGGRSGTIGGCRAAAAAVVISAVGSVGTAGLCGFCLLYLSRLESPAADVIDAVVLTLPAEAGNETAADRADGASERGN